MLVIFVIAITSTMRPKNTSMPHNVVGTIYNANTIHPVPDVMVELQQTGQCTVTDDKGRFNLLDVSNEAPKLVASYLGRDYKLHLNGEGTYPIIPKPPPVLNRTGFKKVLEPWHQDNHLCRQTDTEISKGMVAQSFLLETKFDVQASYSDFYIKVVSAGKEQIIEASLEEPKGSRTNNVDLSDTVQTRDRARQWHYELPPHNQQSLSTLNVKLRVCVIEPRSRSSSPEPIKLEVMGWFEEPESEQ